MSSQSSTGAPPTAPPERFPPPGEDEIAWIVDAVTLAEDAGVRALLASDPDPTVLDLARLASTGAAVLTHLGLGSFGEVTQEHLAPFVLTADQGRAWQSHPGLLHLLRVTVRGHSRGLRFVVCTGCHRWMVAKDVPKAKSCPLTTGCTGPQVGIPAGVVTSITPDQVAPS